MENIKKKQQMTECCYHGRAEKQGGSQVKKVMEGLWKCGFWGSIGRGVKNPSVNQVVPRFRTRVRRWKQQVEDIQKLVFEDTINATGTTGETKLNMKEESW